MSIIKLIHVSCAAISITGFFYRGLLKLYSPQRLKARWIRIAPHVIDTALLVSAIVLMIQSSLYPTTQPWLLTKIVMLLVYIALGLYTLRFARSKLQIMSGFILAILSFGYILAAAITREALPLF
jgi:uncharacterized membrane protein SirB2